MKQKKTTMASVEQKTIKKSNKIDQLSDPFQTESTSHEPVEDRTEIQEEEEPILENFLIEHTPEEPLMNSSLPVYLPLDSEKTIASQDPLRKYLEEIRQYPLLDPQEELELALKLKATGDLQAAKTLVSANLRLVVKIAFEYRAFYSNLLDLIQEGNIGLMKAVYKFDTSKGSRLGYYASWWIRSYILKYLIDNFRLIKIGTTQAQKKLFYHLMKEKERLEAQGLFAGPKLLAEKLNVREKDVIEMQQRLSYGGLEVSLDAPVTPYSDSTTSLCEVLVDDSESIDDTLEREQLLQQLKKKLPLLQSDLNEKEKEVLHARLLAEEPKTLQEVADLYQLTRERARQIESKVISKLRALFKQGRS